MQRQQRKLAAAIRSLESKLPAGNAPISVTRRSQLTQLKQKYEALSRFIKSPIGKGISQFALTTAGKIVAKKMLRKKSGTFIKKADQGEPEFKVTPKLQGEPEF